MASNVYVKSVLWLTLSGGVGYGLMILTKPSEEKLSKIQSTTSRVHLIESEKKKALFLKRLQEASSDPTPVYLKKKEN